MKGVDCEGARFQAECQFALGLAGAMGDDGGFVDDGDTVWNMPWSF